MAVKQFDGVHNPFDKSDFLLNFNGGGIFHVDQRYLVDRQYRNDYLLIYTIDGEGILKYEGNVYHLVPGTIFLIDCYKHHIYGTAGTKWTFYFIHFDTNILRGYVDTLYQDYGPVFSPPNAEFYKHRIHTVIEFFRGYDMSAPHRAVGVITELLSVLYTCREQNCQPKSVSGDTLKIMEVIEEFYHQKITLDMIAKEVGHSKYYLSHQFKADTGISVYQYLILFRIMKGKELLQNTNLSIADIAEKTGFESVSNFIQKFSAYESLTPHQYRRRYS